jgi:hypothetical protein
VSTYSKSNWMNEVDIINADKLCRLIVPTNCAAELCRLIRNQNE